MSRLAEGAVDDRGPPLVGLCRDVIPPPTMHSRMPDMPSTVGRFGRSLVFQSNAQLREVPFDQCTTMQNVLSDMRLLRAGTIEGAASMRIQAVLTVRPYEK
jgi:hypothetical protein